MSVSKEFFEYAGDIPVMLFSICILTEMTVAELGGAESGITARQSAERYLYRFP